MKRATVIGAGGFIGRHLIAHLRQLGWDCRAPARDDREFVHDDLGTVFHCAGLTADFARRPHDIVRAHVGLLDDVLAFARFDTLVYLSSTRLYDGRPGFAGAEVDEDTPLSLDPAQPRHLYDLSKALGESLCRQASGGRARIARLACVYSGGDDDVDGFLGTLLERVRSSERGTLLEIDSSPDAARDYVHVDDVVAALVAIATRGTRPLYNVASGTNIANRELFTRLGKLAGCELRGVRAGPVPCPAPVSIERIQGELGWQPRGLLETLPALLGEAVPC
jgi:nucleoside-diphosphate-sugar epimerase